MRLRLGHLVPAHLGHLVAAAVRLQTPSQVKLDHLAMDQAQAGGIALGAVVEQHLHAYTDTEQRLGGSSLEHGLEQA